MFYLIQFCRLCLKCEGELNNMYNDDIIEKVTTCIKDLEFEDHLPTLICNTCLNKVDTFFEFRNKCLESEFICNSYIDKLLNNCNQSFKVTSLNVHILKNFGKWRKSRGKHHKHRETSTSYKNKGSAEISYKINELNYKTKQDKLLDSSLKDTDNAEFQDEFKIRDCKLTKTTDSYGLGILNHDLKSNISNLEANDIIVILNSSENSNSSSSIEKYEKTNNLPLDAKELNILLTNLPSSNISENDVEESFRKSIAPTAIDCDFESINNNRKRKYSFTETDTSSINNYSSSKNKECEGFKYTSEDSRTSSNIITNIISEASDIKEHKQLKNFDHLLNSNKEVMHLHTKTRSQYNDGNIIDCIEIEDDKICSMLKEKFSSDLNVEIEDELNQNNLPPFSKNTVHNMENEHINVNICSLSDSNCDLKDSNMVATVDSEDQSLTSNDDTMGGTGTGTSSVFETTAIKSKSSITSGSEGNTRDALEDFKGFLPASKKNAQLRTLAKSILKINKRKGTKKSSLPNKNFNLCNWKTVLISHCNSNDLAVSTKKVQRVINILPSVHSDLEGVTQTNIEECGKKETDTRIVKDECNYKRSEINGKITPNENITVNESNEQLTEPINGPKYLSNPGKLCKEKKQTHDSNAATIFNNSEDIIQMEKKCKQNIQNKNAYYRAKCNYTKLHPASSSDESEIDVEEFDEDELKQNYTILRGISRNLNKCDVSYIYRKTIQESLELLRACIPATFIASTSKMSSVAILNYATQYIEAIKQESQLLKNNYNTLIMKRNSLTETLGKLQKSKNVVI